MKNPASHLHQLLPEPPGARPVQQLSPSTYNPGRFKEKASGASSTFTDGNSELCRSPILLLKPQVLHIQRGREGTSDNILAQR